MYKHGRSVLETNNTLTACIFSLGTKSLPLRLEWLLRRLFVDLEIPISLRWIMKVASYCLPRNITNRWSPMFSSGHCKLIRFPLHAYESGRAGYYLLSYYIQFQLGNKTGSKQKYDSTLLLNIVLKIVQKCCFVFFSQLNTKGMDPSKGPPWPTVPHYSPLGMSAPPRL